MRTIVKSLFAVAMLTLSADTVTAQVNGFKWKNNTGPVVTQPGPQNAPGKITCEGTYTIQAGWEKPGIAVAYIPKPTPNGSQATTKFMTSFGGTWGKPVFGGAGGAQVTGTTGYDIELTPGTYQVWAFAVFVRNPPPGGWGGNGTDPNPLTLYTNFYDVTIVAPGGNPIEEEQVPPPAP